MKKRLATLVLVTILALGLVSGGALAAGKFLVVALSASDLMGEYLQNAGFDPSEYTLVSSEDALSAAWDKRGDYAAVVFAYHEMNNSAASKAFFEKHQDEYVAYVKNGGGVFSTVRDDPADHVLINPFRIDYSGSGSYNTTIFSVAKEHPIFAGVDLKTLDKQISGTADPSFVDSGLTTDNADVPAVATMPDNSGNAAIVAGQVGKGRVVFAGAELFWQDYVSLSEHLKLVKNIINWIRGGM